MDMPEPQYEVTMQGDPPRELVTCTIGDSKGAARIFTAGLDEAKGRARRQAEALWKRCQRPLG